MERGHLGNPFRSNQYEHALVYDRPDGQHVEVALMQLPSGKKVLQTAIFNTPGEEPSMVSPAFSLEEVKLRFKFLLQLHDAGII